MGSASSECACDQSDSNGRPITASVLCSHTGLTFDMVGHQGAKVTNEWTVDQLMEAIEAQHGVHRKCQCLKYGGKSLKFDTTLGSIADVNKLETINLFLNVDETKFPQCLGQLSPVPVPFDDALKFGTLHEAYKVRPFYWELASGVLRKYGLRMDDSEITGQVSPLHPIPCLEPKRKQELAIPSDAAQFVWSYPVDGWECVQTADPFDLEGWQGMELGDAALAVRSFLSIGGFVYFDSSGNVVQVTTLVSPEAEAEECGNPTFGKPQAWESEWTPALVRSGRFQPVTIRKFKELGAHFFCWLKPEEIIEGEDGNPCPQQPGIPFGGFVFLFHEDALSTDADHGGLNRYFPSTVNIFSCKRPCLSRHFSATILPGIATGPEHKHVAEEEPRDHLHLSVISDTSLSSEGRMIKSQIMLSNGWFTAPTPLTAATSSMARSTSPSISTGSLTPVYSEEGSSQRQNLSKVAQPPLTWQAVVINEEGSLNELPITPTSFSGVERPWR